MTKVRVIQRMQTSMYWMMKLTLTLVRVQEFSFILEPRKRRYLVSAMCVVKASVRSLVFTVIREATYKRATYNLSVIRISTETQYFTFRRDLT